MAKQTRSFNVPFPPQQAFMLLQAAGNEIPKFGNASADPQNYQMSWSKGWGWTNPVDVRAIVFQAQDGSSHVQMEASILALADPFGFLNKTLNQFETHAMNHVQARQTGSPVPPPPKDNSGLVVNLVILGVVFGLLFLVVAFVLLMAVLN